jgi:hypothetical protein
MSDIWDEPPPEPEDGPSADDLAYLAAVQRRQRVTTEAERLRVQSEARAIVAREDREKAAGLIVVERLPLDRLLREEPPAQSWRVDGLLNTGGRAVLSAPFKTGKSTFVGNLVRALADGEPLLGRFEVQRADAIGVLDTELDRHTLRRWFADQGIASRGSVEVVPLRGKALSFGIVDDDGIAEWAERLRGLDVLVVDPLAPLLSAHGLNEDSATEVGRWLAGFDALLDRAGIGEAVVTHHTGHGGERSRGSIRLRDWPDAEWRLVRDGDEDSPPQDRRRYFTAFGRDVDVSESLLAFDPATRRLRIAGGSRREAAVDHLVPAIVEAVEKAPGITQNGLEMALGGRKAEVRQAARVAAARGLIVRRDGPRKSTEHHPAPTASSASRLRQRTPDDCATASIGDAVQSHSDGQEPGTHSCDTCGESLAEALVDVGLSRHPVCEADAREAS